MKLQAPPSFTGSNNQEGFETFSFRLKMYMGITVLAMVQNMELAEA